MSLPAKYAPTLLQAGLPSGGPLESFAHSCQLQTAHGEWGTVTASAASFGFRLFISFTGSRSAGIAELWCARKIGGWESFSAFVAMPATNVWLHSALTYRIIISVHLYGALFCVVRRPAWQRTVFETSEFPALLLTLKPAHSQTVCVSVARRFERPKRRLGPCSSPGFPGQGRTHLTSRCRGLPPW